MKKILSVVLFGMFILFSAISFSTENDSPKEPTAETKNLDSPLGIWLVADEDAKIELYQNGEFLEGKIVWLKEPDKDGKPKVDFKNPDKTLTARPVLNMIFLTGFKKIKDAKKWEDGKIYDAKSGKTYSAWIKLINENKLQLHGYVGISLFGRTDEWTRSSLK
jgi:uncharacterized protein (DUF2147 family)